MHIIKMLTMPVYNSEKGQHSTVSIILCSYVTLVLCYACAVVARKGSMKFWSYSLETLP